jgi:hypothetical protein
VAHAALVKALPDAKSTVRAGGLDEPLLAAWARASPQATRSNAERP